MRLIHRDQHNAIELHRSGHRTGRVVITFTWFGFHDLDAPGFGDDFLLRQGYDVISFRCSNDSWFQEIDRETLEAVRAATEGYGLVAAYGSSLGGYAAIAFAHLLRVDVVIAISPQFAIDAAFDRRWVAQARRITWRHRIDAQALGNALCFLIHDPTHQADAAQIARLRAALRGSDVVAVDAPCSGHPSTFFLAETGQLAPVVLDLLRGDRSTRIAYPWSRIRVSPTWLAGLGKHAETRDRFRLAEMCYRRAIEFGIDAAGPYHHMAALNERLGRLDEAIRMSRRSVELAPGFAPLAHYLGTLLARAGQIGEAAEMAARAQRLDPGNAGYAHYAHALRAQVDHEKGDAKS